MKSILQAVSIAALTATLACGAYAQSRDLPLHATEDEGELSRGSVPDTTLRQRYNTAVREAYGALKNTQAECRGMRGAERSRCMGDAKVQFDRDMSAARGYTRGNRA